MRVSCCLSGRLIEDVAHQQAGGDDQATPEELGNVMSKSIIITATASADLEPAPISPDWILNGKPEARAKLLAKSYDRNSYVMVWECTAGRFNWHYTEDETVVVISGEVYISTKQGKERRLGQGDMAFFPAGTSCTWHILDHVKKVAVFRKALPLPLGLALQAWHKLLRIGGFGARSPLMPTSLR
jgi:uncharacterized cupin superfamily protein